MPRPVLRPPARAGAVSHRPGAPARVPAVSEEGVVHVAMVKAAVDESGGHERVTRGPGEDRGETDAVAAR